MLYSNLVSDALITPEINGPYDVNKIVIKRTGQLSLVSVGVLSDCNCLDTTFRRIYTGYNNPLPYWSNVNITYGGPSVTTVYKFIDSVSLTCGNKDGFTFCGPRTLRPIRNYKADMSGTGEISDLVTWVEDDVANTVTATF